jgi:F0F1-type ATP synthase membrane subunit b/b'
LINDTKTKLTELRNDPTTQKNIEDLKLFIEEHKNDPSAKALHDKAKALYEKVSKSAEELVEDVKEDAKEEVKKAALEKIKSEATEKYEELKNFMKDNGLDTAADADSESESGDGKAIEKTTSAIDTKKLLKSNIDELNGNPVDQIDEGALANLDDAENDNVVTMKIQSHEGGEENLLLKSNKDAIVVSLSQTHEGKTIAMSGNGQFVDLSVVDPSVEKISGSKTNLLRGMVKDDVQAITMDVEALANVTRDQMSEQEIKLIQLNSGLTPTTPDPSNTLRHSA